MSEEITVSPFDPDKNEDILLAVHAAHFTGSDSAIKRKSYVHWLLANPAEGSIYLAAYVDGAFASFLGFMAREVIGFGRVFRGALAFGAMTLPKYGGRGLYRRLAHAGWEEARHRGFHFALGYTTRQYVLDMEIKMGWSPLGASPVMALPLDVGAILRAAVPRLGFLAPLAAPASWLACKRAANHSEHVTAADCEITAVDAFPDDCDNLTRRLRAGKRLFFSKDQRTLDWLYLSPHNPFKYDIVAARRAGQLVGFAVGRRMEMLGLDGYGIFDLISAPGNHDVLAALASRLIVGALPARPEIVACLVSRNQEAHQALQRLGFIDSRRSFTLIYRAVQDGLPETLHLKDNWTNFWGNNDTV